MSTKDDSSPATKADIKALLKEFTKTIVESRIEPLEKKISEIDKELEVVKEISEAAAETAAFNAEYSRKNNIELHGIPWDANEDVYSLVCSVADAVNVSLDIDHIDIAHRLKTRSSTKPPPIIVKFVTRWKKDEIMKARINKKIMAKDIGFQDSPLRIFINENLTPAKRILAMHARKHFIEKGCTVWTNNGNIFVAKRMSKEERGKISKNDPMAKKYELKSVNEFEVIESKLSGTNERDHNDL